LSFIKVAMNGNNITQSHGDVVTLHFRRHSGLSYVQCSYRKQSPLQGRRSYCCLQIWWFYIVRNIRNTW